MNNILDQISSINNEGIREFQILINGCWQCLISSKTFEVTNPATGELIGLVPDCSGDDVKNAIQAARSEHNLANFSPLERLEIMEKARHILIENTGTLSRLISMESGKPVSLAAGEVKSTAERLFLAHEETRMLYGEYIPGEWGADTKNKFGIVLRKPLGVVVTITPFNYPLFIAAAKIIPAILAGNTVVAKPASDTPLSLIFFVKVLELAGMPPGTINIVTGRGRDIGDVLVQSPDVNAVSFTGSTSIGESIAQKTGITKLHLELGGKASAIVLEDADLDRAARQICIGTFRNSGQRCDAVSRVLVCRNIKELFIKKVLEEAKQYKTGDPADPSTVTGSLINRSAVDRVSRLVKDALDKGARLLYGGGTSGLFFEPAVLDGVTADMDIAWEEIFGPVMPVIEVEDYKEAISISNRSEFGLDSCVFTENINRAISIARELQDGSVTINNVPMHGVGHFPFGGNKKSGLGREGIRYSIDELTRLHTIIFSEY